MSLISKEHLGLTLQTIKKLLSGKADKSELQEEISKVSENIVQSDWNQNDESQLDYIKNRTHYEEEIKTALRENVITVNCNDSGFSGTYGDYYYKDVYAYWLGGWDYLVGKTIKIVFDNEPYDVLINSRNEMADLNDYPFEIYLVSDYTRFGVRESGIHTFEFYLIERELKQLDPKYVGTDWNQNDPNGGGYIKNRTHYETPEIWTLMEFAENDKNDATTGKFCSIPYTWAIDKYYRVRVDGVEYTFDGMIGKNTNIWVNTVYYIGAEYFALNSNMDFTTYPFCILTADFTNIYVVFEDGTTEHAVEFFVSEGEVHQLDHKYIPNSDWNQNDPNGVGYIANRTHYDNEISVSRTREEIYTIITDFIGGPINSGITTIEGLTFRVIADGIIYDNVPVHVGYVAGGTTWVIGDRYSSNNFYTTDYGFAYSGYGYVTNSEKFPNGIENIEVYTVERELKQLDPKYLPLFMVNITESESESGEFVYSADKTFEEIKAASDAGVEVVASIGGMTLELIHIDDNVAGFFFSAIEPDRLFSQAFGRFITITNENDCFSEYSEATLPSTLATPVVPEGIQVGQTVAVKALDEEGFPTEWEAADLTKSVATAPYIRDLLDMIYDYSLFVVENTSVYNPTGVQCSAPLLVLRGNMSYGVFSISAIDADGVFYRGSVNLRDETISLSKADPMVLTSSTEGSTKKFKITVDDSGTLAATEVV